MTHLKGVVVAHAGLAAAMIAAAEQIAGSNSGLVAVSNINCDRGTLEEKITQAVGDASAIVFIDMPSGSCMVAAMRRLGEREGVRVVTGVNLAMLVEFIFHRDGEPDAVAEHIAAVGARAVAAR